MIPSAPARGCSRPGTIPEPAIERLISTLRRYNALCRRHQAQVKAVATSAVREARNKDEVVERVQREVGVQLEVISGKEEARLICLGVLHRKPKDHRSVLIDIGGGSTEIVTAVGERPTNLWSLQLGAVRLTQVFNCRGHHLEQEAQGDAQPRLRGGGQDASGPARGASPRWAWAARAPSTRWWASPGREGAGHATLRELTEAVETLAGLGPAGRRKHFDPQRAEIILSGAVVLEMVAKRLGVETVAAVTRGLRDGVLVDLLQKSDATFEDHGLPEAAIALGRRFHFDEKHHTHVAALSVSLFDQLKRLHQLPPIARAYLEVAALLHDVGNAVSFERHHKHSYYLIQNADLPGLGDRERELVARVARYHRRAPSGSGPRRAGGPDLAEARTVRRLATLLRLANALDRSHRQTVRSMTARS